ncbi:MAG: type IV secretory system conjugative DNA transfer family protein [Nitrospiraceae bacterium]
MSTQEFPPRGSGIVGRPEAPPSAIWGHPHQLGASWNWKPGRVLLGSWQGRLIGRDDDRHIITIAGSRAGKSKTVLIPNLKRYPGSCIVLDPKGELARATARDRIAMGQQVFILDPFGEVLEKGASHNPFNELGFGKASHVAADAAQMADAMVIGNERDPHWTDSGKNLIRGIILHLKTTTRHVTMRDVRKLLSGTPPEHEALFTAMTESPAFDGVVANIGASFLGKLHAGGKELQSILSTVQEQTAPFDDVVGIMDRSDFRLTDLAQGKMTIYLVLPGMRIGTHFRWLRLVIQQALMAMERSPVPYSKLPVWFVLEEFAALGHLRPIATAAGLMAGFGVKLWPVLQDLTQLKTNYSKVWETFLGNAGIIQAFGNVDQTTTEHLSKMLGNCSVVERQDVRVSGAAMAHGDDGRREHIRHVRLLDPNEITQQFARETNRQMVLMPGRPPIYMKRLGFNE